MSRDARCAVNCGSPPEHAASQTQPQSVWLYLDHGNVSDSLNLSTSVAVLSCNNIIVTSALYPYR